MGKKRQKIQLELAFIAEGRGETPKAVIEGIELSMAKRRSESPALPDLLMEEVCQRENLLKALHRVRQNRGNPGIDGMTVDDLSDYLRDYWPNIREQLLQGSYQPQPVKRVEIPKPGGGVRKLGIPTVLDRFIQQSVLQVLQRYWDRTFSEHSYGFRPGRSARAGHRVMGSISSFITRKLKLKVNQSKSRVGKPWECKFLGFRFVGGKESKRSIAPPALARFKARVRELTLRTRGVTIERMIEQVNRYLIGWRGYYGFCETPSILKLLDSWIRRRLRSVVWKQWKRGKRRFAELRRLGVGRNLAAQTAGSAHGPWRLSRSPALSYALPNAYFDRLGLAKLIDRSAA